jgi:hypothetical protein
LYLQENSTNATKTDSFENEEINKTQNETRVTRDANSRCCGTFDESSVYLAQYWPGSFNKTRSLYTGKFLALLS